MDRYWGTKEIEAELQEKDGKKGYAVKYADGYVSWSPKEVFEEAYRPEYSLNFGLAFAALLKGEESKSMEPSAD